MHKPVHLLLTAVAFILIGACLQSSHFPDPAPPAHPFSVLAGSELNDIQQNLADDIRAATAVDLNFTYSGTLAAVDRIPEGAQFDALWVSQSKYLALNDALADRVFAQEKTMLSPVILGLKASKAHALGWDSQEPAWKDIAAAASAGEFTFGMTNPLSSNSGLSAALGVAAAFAKNPDALTAADLRNPHLKDFFTAQSLTSGSSGWLAESYQRDQSTADGIVNYESVLLSLNARGKLAEPLTLIYPKEGIMTADYPLLLLNGAKRADYDKLVAYLRSKTFQSKMSALTLRRPVNPDAEMAPAIPKRTLIELSFPGQASLISSLLDTVLNDARIPGSSRYVLDLSGSMRGDRIELLKRALLMLASDTSGSVERRARFRNREEVGIIAFSSQPSPTVLFSMGPTPAENAKTRAAVTRFVATLQAHGPTAMYSSVQQALVELAQERRSRNEKRYYTVVLMTDGKNNRGLSQTEFNDWYNAQRDNLRGIPVFPILFGEGDFDDLKQLADLTGGRLFDSRSAALPLVFQEIRGYQ